MADLQKQDRPDNRCKAYTAMQPAQEIVRDVAGGTLRLRGQIAPARAANTGGASVSKYLPKFPAEHADDYVTRLATSTLFNAYGRTVQGLVGMVFKKNPALAEDVPEVIRGNTEKGIGGHAENIDLAGTHLDVFAREVLEDAFEGHAFILVDMQKALGAGATLADEIRAGLRPYWVKYKASQAVNFRPVTINGQREIGQITFEEETSVEAGEYGEQEVKRYRTFRLMPYADVATQEIKHTVYWKLQEKRHENGQDVFVILDEGVIKGFSRIPVAVVYGRKTGFLQSQPPLLDLALLNIKYFQKESDRDQSEHKCGNPIPIFKIADQDKQIVPAGSGLGIIIGKDEDAFYLEPEGSALESTRKTLEDLRGQMAALGLSTLAARPQVQATATETIIDFTQESSELESIARSEQDALELCLGFHAQYLGLKSGGSVTLGAHLKSLRLTQAQVQAYSSMASADQLSNRTLWDVLKAGDALPDGFDADTEETRLKDQQKSLGESLLKDFDKGGDPAIV